MGYNFVSWVWFHTFIPKMRFCLPQVVFCCPPLLYDIEIISHILIYHSKCNICGIIRFSTVIPVQQDSVVSQIDMIRQYSWEHYGKCKFQYRQDLEFFVLMSDFALCK